MEPPPTPNKPARKPETAPAPASAAASATRLQLTPLPPSCRGADVQRRRVHTADELAPQDLRVIRRHRFEAHLAQRPELRKTAKVGSYDGAQFGVAAGGLGIPEQDDR